MNLNNANLQSWLEAEVFPGGQPDPGAGGPPSTQPGMPGDPMGDGSQQIPMQQQDVEPNASDDDITQDPQFPQMPEEKESFEEDYEKWKQKFIEESKKGDPIRLVDMINAIRNHNLEAQPRKFVEDNLQINNLRQNSMILTPSQKIRSLLKQDVDQNLPATTLVRHIISALEEQPMVSDIFIKLYGAGGGKQDLHRKFIAGLLGAVQVGSGVNNEDLIYQDVEFYSQISTRYNTKWGDVYLGDWSLYTDDAERFLSDKELDRLQGGSPTERNTLRQRIVLEALVDKYKQRAFIITTVSSDGTVYHLGLDLGNCLDTGYIDGRLVVKFEDSDALEAFIDDDGNVVAIPQLTIYYVRQVDRVGGDQSELEEIEFLRVRQGQIYLSAQNELLTEAVSTLNGLIYKEIPWRGNPTDFITMSRCTPPADEILLRRCN